jgi:putative Holliday junction resolvase
VGIARCDYSRVLALPEATLARDDSTAQRIADIAVEFEAEAVIIGLPLTLSGERGPAAEQVEDFAAHLARIAPCEVRLLDERLTTREAQRGLHRAGRDVRRSRAVIDQAAAVILLNHALDAERASGIPAGRRVNLSRTQD